MKNKPVVSDETLEKQITDFVEAHDPQLMFDPNISDFEDNTDYESVETIKTERRDWNKYWDSVY